MIYVGAAESSEHDQVLDSIMVGPIPVGTNKFIFSVSFYFRYKNSMYINSSLYRLMLPRLSYCQKKTC